MKFKIFITNIFIIFSSNMFSQNYFKDGSFVFVKNGSFYKNSQKIKIKNFYISKYEITNLEYCKFLNKNQLTKDTLNKYIYLQKDECKIYFQDSIFKVKTGFEDLPVVFVSWFGANAFCKYYNLRLPTETEWEYSAIKSKYFFLKNVFRKYPIYSGNDDICNIAWYKKNADNRVHKVGRKKSNYLGIFDMSGNVDEWCSNWYYANNQHNKKEGVYKIIKGGSWYNRKKMLRVFNTRATNPKSQKATIGFRVLKDVATFCKIK